MASGLPKDLAIAGASAKARFKPWQVSCPSPPCGFSPCRMNKIVSTAFSLRPATVPAKRPDNDNATIAATLVEAIQFKILNDLVHYCRFIR